MALTKKREDELIEAMIDMDDEAFAAWIERQPDKDELVVASVDLMRTYGREEVER